MTKRIREVDVVELFNTRPHNLARILNSYYVQTYGTFCWSCGKGLAPRFIIKDQGRATKKRYYCLACAESFGWRHAIR